MVLALRRTTPRLADWFQKAADKDNTGVAMTQPWRLFANGYGVCRTLRQGARVVREAAAKGDTSAMAYLGVLYYHGQGVTQTTPRRANGVRKLLTRETRDAMAAPSVKALARRLTAMGVRVSLSAAF